MKDLLNDYQFNSLVVTLRSFEEHLRQAQEWLDGREESGILYQRHLRLSPQQQDAAREEIAKAFQLITDLVNNFGLQPVEENPLDLIRGNLSVSWANLIDTRSTGLGRYGDIDPGLIDVLDPSIERLAQAAIALTRILNPSSDQVE